MNSPALAEAIQEITLPDNLKTKLQKKYKTVFEDVFSEEVWTSTYKDHNDETINDTLFRVAVAAASMEKTDQLREEWTENFYDLLSNFKATAGGRIYANAGTEWKGTTLMNCFVGPRKKKDIDSLNSIIAHLHSQAHTLKSEGGWGENFSYIRPRGAFIHGIGVETPGAVKYMELFDKSSEIITSGSGKKSHNKKAKGKIRKGAMMGVLDVWHPDVIEFITAKQQSGRLTKFNVSVNCTDEFMDLVTKLLKMQEDGASEEELAAVDQWHLRFPDTMFAKYENEWDGNMKAWEAKGYPTKTYQTISALWLWNLIMESTYNRAEPGVLFLDRANYFLPLNYAETVFATNPCVTADTWVHTAKGPRQVSELLSGKNVLRVNGEDYEATNFFFTGKKDIYELKGKHGYSVRLTANHKILVNRGNKTEWVEAKDIRDGDRLVLNNHRENTEWQGEGNADEGYLMGLAVGDGWVSSGKVTLSVFAKGENTNTGIQPILEEVKNIHGSLTNQFVREWWHSVERSEYRYYSPLMNGLAVKFNLGTKQIGKEIEKSSSEFYKGFLRGLFDSDGTVLGNVEGGASVRLWQADAAFLKTVQRMLHRLGIVSTVYENRILACEKEMPDGRGGTKSYNCVDQHELSVSKESLVRFRDLIGFVDSTKAQKLDNIVSSYTKGPYKDKFEDEFDSLTYVGLEDVFDISVPGINAFDANGLYVHNCGEQTLAPGGVCNLASLNLTQFVNKKGTGFDLKRIEKYTRYLVRFLDNINDLTKAPLPEYEYSIRNKRRIGVGILGWGSALYMLKTRFASDEANELRDEVMRTIARTAYMASIDLAVEKGMFKECVPKWHKEGPFVKSLDLPAEYMEKLATTGIRNSSLLSIQPTGNTSILANVVSGGLEPVFMHDYIRTVIVNHMPDEIADVCPKWYEGEWKETKMFKFAKEGDEEILRGKGPDGTVYKIDKNRGLTKEVLCEDYGVRYMRQKGEWDARRAWTATAMSMSVADHVNDLIGFARWVDSAMSKTVNVPNDYPFEDFKNIYLNSYASGYVKGVTTYRAGTMTTVLSAKEEKEADLDDEEIILENVEMPESTPATMKRLRAEGKKWYMTVVWNETQTRPFALFVHTNHHEKNVVAEGAVEALTALARTKGIPEHHIEGVLEKIVSDNNATKISRMISLCLRHGVLIKNIVYALDKLEHAYVGTFLFAVKKWLATFIKDGEKVEGTCLDCGSTQIVYREGCSVCLACGSSKCG